MRERIKDLLWFPVCMITYFFRRIPPGEGDR